MKSKSVGTTITVVWLAAFVAGFFGGIAGRLGDIVCLAVGGYFVVELAVLYRRERIGLRAFLRRHAVDIAFLVPVFRGLRLLRLFRRVRRLLGALDAVVEGADIASTAQARRLADWGRHARA